MFDREVGAARLEMIARTSADQVHSKFLESDSQVTLELDIKSIAYQPPSNSDVELFNRIAPNLQLIVSSDGIFRLKSIAPKYSIEDAQKVELDENTAIPRAFHIATRFLAALSISSFGLFIWRQLDVSPISAFAIRPNGIRETVQFARIESKFPQIVPLHAGHLCGAVDIYGYLAQQDWSDRFFEIYQKGETLLAFPSHALVNFFDEAYLCFFRCLEYVTMVKILNRKGQFNEKQLALACKQIGLDLETQREMNSRQLFLEMGQKLVRQRGEASAHLAKGMQEEQLGIDEVYQLKKLADKMIHLYTLSGLFASAHSPQ